MSEVSKILKNLSDSRVKELGAGIQAVGWSNVEQQQLRFRKLIEHIHIIPNESFLDLGCGFGDLMEYITRKIDFPDKLNYTGCDISALMLDEAGKRNDKLEFICMDMWNPENILGRKFDHILCSGALNYSVLDREQLGVEKFLEIYWPFSSKTISFNLITSDVDFQNPKLRYSDPSIVIDTVRKYTKRYIIDSSYPLWEFTVILFK